MYLQKLANQGKLQVVNLPKSNRKASGKRKGRKTHVPRINRELNQYKRELTAVSREMGVKKRLKKLEMDVLANIMTPYSCNPVRICASTGINNPPLTALAKNFIVVDYDLQALLNLTEGEILELPEVDKNELLWNLPNDITVILLHDAYVPVIYPKYANAATGIYAAELFLDPNYSHGNTPYYFIPVEPNEIEVALESQLISPLNFSRLSADSGWPEIIPCFSVDGRRLFWVDASHHTPSEITLTLNMAFTTYTFDYGAEMLVYRFMPGEGFELVATAWLSTVAAGGQSTSTVHVNYSGYYFVRIDGRMKITSGDIGARFGAIINLSMSTSVATHHVINNNVDNFGLKYSNFIPTFDSIQEIGTCLLWQNVSPEFIKGGTTSGYTWSGDEAWYEISSRSETDFLNRNSRLVFNGMWSEGMYGYVRPVTTGFTKHTGIANLAEAPDTSSTVVAYNRTAPINPIGNGPSSDACRGMSVFRIKPPAPTNPATTFGSVTSRLIITLNFEFSTTSQNFVLGRPTVFPPMYSELVAHHLNALIPFSNNFDHVQGMWNKIKGIASSIDDGYNIVKKLLQTGASFIDYLF